MSFEHNALAGELHFNFSMVRSNLAAEGTQRIIASISLRVGKGSTLGTKECHENNKVNNKKVGPT